MGLLHLIIIAVVQGITEFLPISSSGHLVLVPFLFGYADQGLLIDLSVHLGTLFAVLIYFWQDTKGLSIALFASLGSNKAKVATKDTDYVRLLQILILASIPIVIAGYAFVAFGLTDLLRDTTIIAIASIVFGIVLYVADTYFKQDREMSGLSFKDGFLIGLSQILALIPGTSRSGITMTAGRALGFSRVISARFSMLLAIPTILAAATLGIVELAQHGSQEQITDAVIAGTLAFVTAIGAIHFLMRWLVNASMTIFVIYRVLLGVGLLIFIS